MRTRRTQSRRRKPRTTPDPLQSVLAFVRTVDPLTEEDTFTDPAALAGWLRDQGLLAADAELDAAALEQARSLRQRLLEMFKASGRRKPLGVKATERLDAIAAATPVRIRFRRDGTTGFEPAVEGFDGACAELLLAVGAAWRDGHWRRLKICAEPGCQQPFFDASNNLTGRFCSKRCGSRLHARNHRQRTRS